MTGTIWSHVPKSRDLPLLLDGRVRGADFARALARRASRSLPARSGRARRTPRIPPGRDRGARHGPRTIWRRRSDLSRFTKALERQAEEQGVPVARLDAWPTWHEAGRDAGHYRRGHPGRRGEIRRPPRRLDARQIPHAAHRQAAAQPDRREPSPRGGAGGMASPGTSQRPGSRKALRMFSTTATSPEVAPGGRTKGKSRDSPTGLTKPTSHGSGPARRTKTSSRASLIRSTGYPLSPWISASAKKASPTSSTIPRNFVS